MNENETENTEQLPEPDAPSLNMVGVIQDGKFIPYGMTGIRGGIPVYVFNTYEDYEAAAPTLPETCMIVTLEDLETGGFEFDEELSETSRNAVQNRIITAALKKKASFESPGVVQFSGSESVTDRESGLALAASEKNASLEGTLASRIAANKSGIDRLSAVEKHYVSSNSDLQNFMELLKTKKDITIGILGVNYGNNPIFLAGGNNTGGTGIFINFAINAGYGSVIFFSYGTSGIVKCDLENGTWKSWVAI